MNFKQVLLSELKPAKYNPRKDLQPSDPEYQHIKKSIEEFGYVDPVIVNSDYTVIGGHQRLKVLKDLGMAQIDVVVVDIPKIKEKALNVALNKITGEWDTQRLTDLLGELKAEGMDISITGFDEAGFNQMVENLNGLVIDDPSKEWQGMPEFKPEDLTAKHSIIVNFAEYEDIQTFARRIEQKLTDKTRSIWYPKAEILHSSLVVEDE